ncbi:MAG: hypothetical protein IRY95_08275 [Clostridia bacterium]|nr:hypothetical protein [Clostridia bacterium]
MLRAVLEADRRFDGLFFYGVTSTRIFCFPSCASRKPRPERVRFFRTAAEAAVAGFRPCKRCRPDRAFTLFLAPKPPPPVGDDRDRALHLVQEDAQYEAEGRC